MRPHAAAPVLHIAETARGGVGTWLNQLLPELDPGCVPGPVSAGSRCDDDTPLRVHVVLPAQDRFMLSHVGDAAISTYRRDGRSPLSLLILACAAWCALRATRPHIVHLHSTFAGLVVRPLLLVARLLPGPRPHVVYSPHGWAFQIAAAPLRRRAIVAVERWLAHLTDRIVVLSDAEHAECIALGFPAAKLLRIYNGIAENAPPVADAPADWADPRLKVLFVGRFDRQKGLDTLLAAAEGAADRMVVRCIGAGVVDGGRAAAPPANVELLGWLDEPRITAQLAQADVVAMPSRWEGFGLVALEAMRAARPVVASHVGGLPEVVEDGVTGRLVAPDDADALRAALLADPPAVRHRMGAAGRARFVARFTARRSARGVATLYRHLLRHERRQPVAASWA